MKAAIEQLRISLGILETNEPINRAEGDTAQADLEAANAAEFRDAIRILEQWQSVRENGGILTVLPPDSEKDWREYLTPKPTAEATQ